MLGTYDEAFNFLALLKKIKKDKKVIIED